jgi:undecaprenyl-diphosphatase
MSVLGYVEASDFRISGRLLEWQPPRWFRISMVAATRAGDGWLWLAVGLALAAGGSDGHRVLAAAALSAGLANILQVLAKRRFRRTRPCDSECFGRSAYGMKPLGHFPSDRYSFPSGHALNAFAIGSVVSLAFPPLAAPVLLAAASVAASRVVLGLHFLSDVVAGSVLGLLIGAGSYLLMLV